MLLEGRGAALGRPRADLMCESVMGKDVQRGGPEWEARALEEEHGDRCLRALNTFEVLFKFFFS